MNTRETLAAEDEDDLAVIAARLQDAVARVKDFAWLPKSRRFAGVFNRFKWEEATKRRSGNLRIRSGLHFEGVVSVKAHKLNRDNPNAVLSLLTIGFTRRGPEDPGGTVELVFAGGGSIRLEVEYLEAALSDLSGEWAARGRPVHADDEG
jgi:hypothetical protein